MTALEKILVAVLIGAGPAILADMFSPRYAEFTAESRSRSCTSNQNSIDKCVGIWESQQVALPTDKDVWIDFWTDGSIARVSPDFEAFMLRAAVPREHKLVPGSREVFAYARDVNLFRCAQRVIDRGGEAFGEGPREIHYRWWQGRPGRYGRTRGTMCMIYDRCGPPDWPDRPHRP